MTSAKEVLALLPAFKKDEHITLHASNLSQIYKLLKAEKNNITKVTSEPIKMMFGIYSETKWENRALVIDTKSKGTEMDGHHITVETHRATYKVKVPANTKVADAFNELLDIDAVPSVAAKPAPVQTIVLSADIMQAIKKAITFCSKDDLRPAFQAVNLKIDHSSLQVISTDAHRLFMSPSFKLKEKFKKPLEILLPAASFKKALPKNTEAFTLNMYADDTFDLSIYSGKITDAKFPDFKAVVPEYKGSVTFNRLKMIEKIKSVITYSNKSTSQVNFNINDQINLHTQDVDFSFESNAALPYLQKKVIDFKLSFNGEFLLSALNTFKEENVTLETDGDINRCGILTAGNERILIMPLKFSESLNEAETEVPEPVVDHAPSGPIGKTRRILTGYLQWIFEKYNDTFVHIYPDRISIRFVTVQDNRVTKGSRLLYLPSNDIRYLLPELHTLADHYGKKLIEKTA